MQGNLYVDVPVKYSFQDEGHTGKIHNAESDIPKHYGMFIFDLGKSHEKSIAFRIVLNVVSLDSNLMVGEPLFDIIPGGFTNPIRIPYTNFLTDSDLEFCGWEPVMIPDGSTGELKVVKNTVPMGFGTGLILDFVFNFTDRFLGFLIDPYVLSKDKYFILQFYNEFASVSKRPSLKVQSSTVCLTLSDKMAGKDSTNYLSPKLTNNKDLGLGFDKSRYDVKFKHFDDGYTHDRSNGLKIRGTDPAVNYSMLIKNIALSEKGKIVEIYGFNGYTERYYYPDYIKVVLEKVNIKKLNVVTWSGLLVEFPWASMLWYGEIFYFADQEEFGECCRLFFKEHGEDLCPICGNPLGGQFKYSYIDVTKIPHQIYFCSKDCLHRFNVNMIQYLYMFHLKDNIEYITSIQI